MTSKGTDLLRALDRSAASITSGPIPAGSPSVTAMGLSVATLEDFNVGLLAKLLDPDLVGILAVAALEDLFNHIA